ncbi:probable peptidyl-tRNA hydrolase isoform X2 [Dicentrarchus labrax]|nr:probable peptidyl-tRNA hydrolase isoform X2 [Dicentrarchus labrax]XP_051279165.1 probable peptidyl-tRNA hydrolase isoform X2 [Dicentrarchus labrax]XP_051279166.1 probable peptidyl-tRNA hydrolase isoform X2 [Dicentrarchus labrax]XP_051279167.1 probable peptidyl-tRNA hydrolase isoform X2 [Dicentrarchus labrax]
MRRLLTRTINRLLLGEQFTAAMGVEEQIHTEGRRRLVVGLGNSGMEGTRHSVGMAVLGALATRLSVGDRWRSDKHVSGEVIVSEVERTHVVLLRPRLLMNVNGVSVAKAARKYCIKPEDILLVHDELDKPLGKITIKHGGSARGHNGVRSCVDCLQTNVMPRLLVGIGRPTGKTPVDRHVLGRFSSDEKKVLDSVLVQSVDLLLKQLSQQDSQQDPQSPSSPAGGRRAAQKRKEPSASPAEDSAAGQS